MSLEDMAHDVLIAMANLFRVGILLRPETDHAGAETFALDTALVVDLLVDLLEFPEGLSDSDDFHLSTRQ
jgi:hypothetical protein